MPHTLCTSCGAELVDLMALLSSLQWELLEVKFMNKLFVWACLSWSQTNKTRLYCRRSSTLHVLSKEQMDGQRLSWVNFSMGEEKMTNYRLNLWRQKLIPRRLASLLKGSRSGQQRVSKICVFISINGLFGWRGEGGGVELS